MNEQTNEKKTSFIFRHNIIPKILCLLGAFFIWIYVAQAELVETERTFTGVVVNVDNSALLASNTGLYPYSGYGNLANITVVGRKNVIRDFTADDIRVSVDLSTVKEAGEQQEMKLIVSLPDGLTLKSIDPETIKMDFDNRISKDVAVAVGSTTFGGVATEDHTVEFVPQFSTITVKGPQKVVDDISRVLVDPDFGSGTVLERSLKVSADVRFESFSGSEIDTRYLEFVRQIDVTAVVEKEISVPVNVVLNNEHLLTQNNLKVSPAEIRIRGEVSKLDNFSITVNVDEKDLLTGQTDKVVDLSFPEGSEDVEIIDGVYQATVFIEWPKETVTSSFTVDNITVNGASGRIYELVTQSIRVSVRGLKNDIAKLTAGDIKVVVDLTGQNDSYPGKTSIIAELIFPDDTVYELGEYKVEVIIGGES